MIMKTITWNQQNEEITDEGFFLEGEAAMKADMAMFAAEGAPDTDQAIFVSWEATDRDSADITAMLPDTLIAWMEENDVFF